MKVTFEQVVEINNILIPLNIPFDVSYDCDRQWHMPTHKEDMLYDVRVNLNGTDLLNIIKYVKESK